MKRFLCAVAALSAVVTAPASAQTLRTFRCSNSTVLRVIFDEQRGTATIIPFGRPSIRLHRREEAGSFFRYARQNTQELRGTLQQVQWRSGSAEWTCRP
ncbi:MAG: hypothetical protein NT015_01740 [Alphaproteobacteria bacterium]|nr:hypothetical protein [Alphaproteobacteria bacterium]